MNIRLAALATVFSAFLFLTVVAVLQHSFFGVFEAAFRDSASMQVFFDLVISASLFAVWMLVDARRRGAVVWPYLLALPAVGSFSPLVYLMLREWHAAEDRQLPSRNIERAPAR